MVVCCIFPTFHTYPVSSIKANVILDMMGFWVYVPVIASFWKQKGNKQWHLNEASDQGLQCLQMSLIRNTSTRHKWVIQLSPVMRKPVYAIHKPPRCRPASASAVWAASLLLNARKIQYLWLLQAEFSRVTVMTSHIKYLGKKWRLFLNCLPFCLHHLHLIF